MYNFCVCVSMYTTNVCNKSTDSFHFMFVAPPLPYSPLCIMDFLNSYALKRN